MCTAVVYVYVMRNKSFVCSMHVKYHMASLGQAVLVALSVLFYSRYSNRRCEHVE